MFLHAWFLKYQFIKKIKNQLNLKINSVCENIFFIKNTFIKRQQNNELLTRGKNDYSERFYHT